MAGGSLRPKSGELARRRQELGGGGARGGHGLPRGGLGAAGGDRRHAVPGGRGGEARRCSDDGERAGLDQEASAQRGEPVQGLGLGRGWLEVMGRRGAGASGGSNGGWWWLSRFLAGEA